VCYLEDNIRPDFYLLSHLSDRPQNRLPAGTAPLLVPPTPVHLWETETTKLKRRDQIIPTSVILSAAG
jgi:hypothetical protein